MYFASKCILLVLALQVLSATAGQWEYKYLYDRPDLITLGRDSGPLNYLENTIYLKKPFDRQIHYVKLTVNADVQPYSVLFYNNVNSPYIEVKFPFLPTPGYYSVIYKGK